ncbi:5-deoxy-glucuronate isomerase [Chryseobacterium sp. BIGb0232]|uniref:5-deoxy-glucuronate isomerase n=1 Tax=Chryseobacterium sp. BIGb0232 TaxID=2940598 RepID=UPI000F477D5F|nr:5-deoxy-glucuronate isomerase [Chryseobacterium sp. BIGb0232]MCS4305207.1 5-deoxy-glucuronate isomerase [Chryseobacterium sp. BIGb0232]ROS07645.1 5-deoxy-glucuronate isomerase [Chryseobacterium nakagawai]
MNILIKPQKQKIYQTISAENAGWTWLNFETRLMGPNETWAYDTGGNEMVIVLLSGNYKVESNRGNWEIKNGRKNVFEGVAHTLYLPRKTQFTLISTSEVLDIAYCWCKADSDFEPQLIIPEETPTVIFGGSNATRQFNDLIPPGFGCSRIVCREVYTPSGNWSSFPAHKHDERIVNNEGQLLEAQLEEIYFYKFQKPEAYAIQQIYTKDEKDSLDEIVRARNNDAVLVPKGYHPVAAAHGYHCYYLNFLAGSDQSLANTTDSDYQWIFDSWKEKDPRLPLVTPAMNNQ